MAMRLDQGIDDAPRIALQAALGKKGNHIDIPHKCRSPQRQIADIAGSDPDAVECSTKGGSTDCVNTAHSCSLASALTAAAAMALPPLRPLTTRNGTRLWAARACLDSAAPTKPTGTPMMAAGSGAPSSSISSSRNSEVGALPMATTAPSRCGRQSSSAAAERVFPTSVASCATVGSSRVQTTLLFLGNLLRVMPWATIFASQRTGAPRASALDARAVNVGDIKRSSAISTIPQAWMILTANFSSFCLNRERLASARMIANELR